MSGVVVLHRNSCVVQLIRDTSQIVPHAIPDARKVRMSIGRPWGDTGRFRSHGDGRIHTLSFLGNDRGRKQAQRYGHRNERAISKITHEVCNLSFLPYCHFGEILRKTANAFEYEPVSAADTNSYLIFPEF